MILCPSIRYWKNDVLSVCGRVLIDLLTLLKVYPFPPLNVVSYRYLSYKYDICPTVWYKPFDHISYSVNLFINNSIVHCNEAVMIRNMCIQIDFN